VKEHVGEADPFDDMCLVIIERYQQEEELSTEQQIAKLKSASVDIPTSDVKSS